MVQNSIHPSRRLALSGWFGGRPDRLFIVLGLLFGVLFVAVTPPFQVPDEPHHFYRAYQIAQGQLFVERRDSGAGGELPASLVRTVEAVIDDIPFHPENKADPAAIRAAFAIPLERSRTAFVAFSNTAIYSFIPYVPQALAIAVGRQLNLSPLWLLYLGRLVNLCVAILLIGRTIRITPIFKRGFLLIGLIPMAVYEMASVSPDAFTNSLAFLFTACILDLAYGEQRRVTPGTVGWLMILGALLAACKSAYFPLAFLFFLVPTSKAPTRRSWLIAGVLVVLASVISFMFWNSIAAETFVSFRRGSYPSFAAAQQFIFEHPLRYARNLLDNVTWYGLFYIHSFVGILGWLDAPLPVPFVVIYLVALAFVAIFDDARWGISGKQQVVILGIVAVSVVLILTSQFILWSSIAAGTIGRAQGRYFIPIAPPAFLLLHSLRLTRRLTWRAPERVFAWMAGVLPCCGLLLALVLIVVRYYGGDLASF